jgi:rhodanese-related sulfurtransferase
MKKADAIIALYPNVAKVENNEIAYDAEGNAVVYSEATVQAYIDANAYKEQRAKAYPSIADQLDTIYHGGIDTWKTAIQAVKDRYPKP